MIWFDLLWNNFRTNLVIFKKKLFYRIGSWTPSYYFHCSANDFLSASGSAAAAISRIINHGVFKIYIFRSHLKFRNWLATSGTMRKRRKCHGKQILLSHFDSLRLLSVKIPFSRWKRRFFSFLPFCRWLFGSKIFKVKNSAVTRR